MTTREGNAPDVLLFGTDGEVLVDLKCYRGDRANVSGADIKAQIHEGIMQLKMKPSRVSQNAPSLGVEPQDVAEFVKRLPVAA